MKKYVDIDGMTVELDIELVKRGVGKYYSLMIEDVMTDNDFTINDLLFTWVEPDLDSCMIYNEMQTVMIGQSFDLNGNLYEIKWIKKDGVDLESVNGLDEFADWNKPYSIELVEED